MLSLRGAWFVATSASSPATRLSAPNWLAADTLPSKTAIVASRSPTPTRNSVPSTPALTNGVLIVNGFGVRDMTWITPASRSSSDVGCASGSGRVSVVCWSRRTVVSLPSRSAARLRACTRTVSPGQSAAFGCAVRQPVSPDLRSSTPPCAETRRATAGAHSCAARTPWTRPAAMINAPAKMIAAFLAHTSIHRQTTP